MMHLAPLPGTPLYNADGGIDAIVEAARRDLKALQAADVDAVMF
ncbi:BtpA/SgcQ family protein, partial [Pseudomonas sp. SB113]